MRAKLMIWIYLSCLGVVVFSINTVKHLFNVQLVVYFLFGFSLEVFVWQWMTRRISLSSSVMVWNNKDWKVPWVKDIEGILTRYYGDTPRAVSYKWKEVIEKCTHFRCVRHEILPGTLLKVRKNTYTSSPSVFHVDYLFSPEIRCYKEKQECYFSETNSFLFCLFEVLDFSQIVFFFFFF